ncbi:hypothetical protein [Paracidobacterium acidisoli]|uniref:Uncharacterized protein n=1 Tax=Paracidobacterium acidisoli TaxID=2303751 RepID=A0A372IR54_9BACT|nr:hypothetical protein [Paracidobacterium acidisoli]MBT9330225.1 hypothetical protein [Paracidobacterium acidisoli]
MRFRHLAGLFFFFLIPAAPGTFAQQAPAAPPQSSAADEAPVALVRIATQNELAAVREHTPLRFQLRKIDDRRDTTREIIETRNGDVARLIAVNGKPLSPDAMQAEVGRLEYLREHPELQEHRRKREQEDTDRVNGIIRLLPDAFLYRDEGMTPCPSGQCRRFTFSPKPDFDPPNLEANILRGMAGEMWIDPGQQRITRIEGHLIDDVDFGWGVLGRLHKGGTVLLEQSEVGSHQWAITRLKLNLTGRALLVKSLSIQLTEEESSFSPLPSPVDFRQAIQMLIHSDGSSAQLAGLRDEPAPAQL